MAPLAIDKSLLALDGALVLQVMDRDGAAFETKADDARAWIERAEKKALRVAITFQVDDEHAEELSPCWSYPKSESWSLRVRPLRYELIDTAGKSLASSATERMEEIDSWLGKKGPDVEITAQKTEGGRAAHGTTKEDGTFEIKPAQPLTPGTYLVLITKNVTKDGKVISSHGEVDPVNMMGSGDVKNVIPAEYGTVDRTPLKVEIKAGDNELAPFEIKGKIGR